MSSGVNLFPVLLFASGDRCLVPRRLIQFRIVTVETLNNSETSPIDCPFFVFMLFHRFVFCFSKKWFRCLSVLRFLVMGRFLNNYIVERDHTHRTGKGNQITGGNWLICGNVRQINTGYFHTSIE